MDKARLDNKGRVTLPEEALSGLKPDSEFDVVREGNTLTLVAVNERGRETVDYLQAQALRLWTEATPEERIKAFCEWFETPRPKAPPLSDEALHRENMYD